MCNILLSIIVPFYKVPLELLDNCLESIFFDCCYTDKIEVILINDGSPNSPDRVVDKYRCNAIRYIIQENKGLGGARNAGMINSVGKYIMFLDADDYLVRGAINSIVYWIESNENRGQSSDMLRFNFVITSHLKQNNALVSKFPIRTFKVDASAYFYMYNMSPQVWKNVIRRDCLLNSEGFLLFSDKIYYEDELWTPQMMSRISNVELTDEILYCYYSNPNSIMRDKCHEEKRNKDWLYVVGELNKISNTKKCKPFFEARLRKIVLAHIYLLAYQLSSYKDLENYISFLKEEGLFPMKLYGCNKNVTIQMHIFAWLCNFKITRYLTFICLRQKFARNLRREEH